MNAPDALAALDGPAPARRALPWGLWPVTAVVILLLSFGSAMYLPPGSAVAAWWPAAGVSVWFVLRTRGGGRRSLAAAVVFATTFVANLLAGRDPLTATGFALANTAEVFVVAAILDPRATQSFALRTVVDALRFALATIAGAAACGVAVGVTLLALHGQSPLDNGLAVTASHASAVLLIAPFAVLPARARVPFSRLEAAAQTVVLAASIAVVFTPTNALPLAFLPFTALAWAAFRFSMTFTLAQLLATSAAVIGLSLLGGGPFTGTALGPTASARLITVFFLALGLITLLLVTARHELRVAARAAAGTAQLVTGGLVEAQVGLAVASEEEGFVRLLWANRAGAALLAHELTVDQRWSGPIADAALTSLSTRSDTVYTTDDTTLRLAADRVEGDETRFVVQFVDIGHLTRAMAAQEVAERVRREAEAVRQDLERQRQGFVATTSHELRTPITNILGYAELLEDSATLTATEREWVRAIDRGGRRLRVLVENLLTLGSPSAAPAAERRTIDAGQALTDALAPTAQAIADKELTVRIDADADTVVHVIPTDLHRALTALVANAVTFSPAGGRIRLSARTEHTMTVLTVADSGAGMTPPDIARAFEHFYRAPAAEHASAPGTGIGLPLARQLVERNDGTVHLVSPASGGLEASLRLPRAAQTATSGMQASSTTSRPR